MNTVRARSVLKLIQNIFVVRFAIHSYVLSCNIIYNVFRRHHTSCFKTIHYSIYVIVITFFYLKLVFMYIVTIRLETVELIITKRPELIRSYNSRAAGIMFAHTPLHLASRNGHK